MTGFRSIAALACLSAGFGAFDDNPPRLRRTQPDREHFIPAEKISKRKARRLRGKAKQS